MEKCVVICLPYAGGNKYSYKIFEHCAPRHLVILPVEYPGRGARSKEPLVNNTMTLVDDVYSHILPVIDAGIPYAIYGHSMGALIGWLLVRQIVKNAHRPPVHLFISGTPGPSARSRGVIKRHALEKTEFIKEVVSLNGSASEIFSDPELLDYLEPILRADFRISETFCYEEGPPIDVPFTVITGRDESMSAEDIECWQKESSFPVDFRKMPGDHFFINRYASAILELMTKKIATPNLSFYGQ
jgi:surfactin synthase thioesterase subunit